MSNLPNDVPTFQNENGSIIMGIVRSLEYDDLKPFLATLHSTGYAGGVTFFCDDISSNTRTIFSSMGIYLRDFKEVRVTIPFLGKKINFYVLSKEAQNTFASKAFHIHQSRHFLYTAFLEKESTFSKVMLSDTRDVVFQRDPFDFVINDDLCCFLEDPKTTIAGEKHNAGWIRRAFGEDILNHIGNNTISCAGITMGSASAILEYTSEMCRILLTPKVRAIAGITGLDQGIHNYSIRMNLFGDRLHLYENMRGPVMTMGLMNKDSLRQHPDHGLLLNEDGTICHTIHQYDRHPDLLHTLPQKILQANHHISTF